MRFSHWMMPCLALVALTAGCTLQEAKDTPSPSDTTAAVPPPAESTPASAPSITAPPAAAPSGEASKMQAGGPGGMMPQGMAGSMPTAPLTKTPELDKKVADAEKSGDKKQIAAAYAERGTFRMNDQDAGAKVKYRAALEDYRKALAADPANAEATQNKKMIEDIYRSMGRPIPGEEGAGSSIKP